MTEVNVDPFEFFSGLDNKSDQLFHARGEGLREILILTRDDGTETEAIVPIEEYRRLGRLAARARSGEVVGR